MSGTPDVSDLESLASPVLTSILSCGLPDIPNQSEHDEGMSKQADEHTIRNLFPSMPYTTTSQASHHKQPATTPSLDTFREVIIPPPEILDYSENSMQDTSEHTNTCASPNASEAQSEKSIDISPTKLYSSPSNTSDALLTNNYTHPLHHHHHIYMESPGNVADAVDATQTLTFYPEPNEINLYADEKSYTTSYPTPQYHKNMSNYGSSGYKDTIKNETKTQDSPSNQSSTSIKSLHSQFHDEPSVNESTSLLTPSSTQLPPVEILQKFRSQQRKTPKLGEFRATAICGNDATGSILYMLGPCVTASGVLAPIAVALVSMVLYLFRFIYGEAITALPQNGGAYNVLLNTTRKSTAAIAAVQTLLSYTATAVVSSAEATHYLQHATQFNPSYTLHGTLGILIFFSLISFLGVSESATVALIIQITHLTCLTILCCFSTYTIFTEVGWNVFQHNINLLELNWYSIAKGIFYGFSSAMLGVTGFETSANYVEEQKKGVYVKTLRNMWWQVTIFNFIITTLTTFLLPIDKIIEYGYSATVVAHLARRAALNIKSPFHFLASITSTTSLVGDQQLPDEIRDDTALYTPLPLLGTPNWLELIIAFDAFLVLAGGVLTSFVGVVGLSHRLALDRCLPQILLATNSLRNTNHWIIFGFAILCANMYLALDQNVSTLGETYSVSFLSVMAQFAFGVILIKVKRPSLVKQVNASWVTVLVAFLAVLVAQYGAISRNTTVIKAFLLYFSGFFIVVLSMLHRARLLNACISILRKLSCVKFYHTSQAPHLISSYNLEKTSSDILGIEQYELYKTTAQDTLNIDQAIPKSLQSSILKCPSLSYIHLTSCGMISAAMNDNPQKDKDTMPQQDMNISFIHSYMHSLEHLLYSIQKSYEIVPENKRLDNISNMCYQHFLTEYKLVIQEYKNILTASMTSSKHEDTKETSVQYNNDVVRRNSFDESLKPKSKNKKLKKKVSDKRMTELMKIPKLSQTITQTYNSFSIPSISSLSAMKKDVIDDIIQKTLEYCHTSSISNEPTISFDSILTNAHYPSPIPIMDGSDAMGVINNMYVYLIQLPPPMVAHIFYTYQVLKMPINLAIKTIYANDYIHTILHDDYAIAKQTIEKMSEIVNVHEKVLRKIRKKILFHYQQHLCASISELLNSLPDVYELGNVFHQDIKVISSHDLKQKVFKLQYKIGCLLMTRAAFIMIKNKNQAWRRPYLANNNNRPTKNYDTGLPSIDYETVQKQLDTSFRPSSLTSATKAPIPLNTLNTSIQFLHPTETSDSSISFITSHQIPQTFFEKMQYKFGKFFVKILQNLEQSRRQLLDSPMGFFAKKCELSNLNQAIQYVLQNEDCHWIRIIHCFVDEKQIPPTLYRDVNILSEEYPDLTIDLVLVKGAFNPAMVAYLSVKLQISRNYLFITSPQPGFTTKLEDLGGVRLIMH